MKKDIPFLEFEGVTLAIARKEENEWHVYLINRSNNTLQNVMITSKGYGEKDREKQKTSVLRHMFEAIHSGIFAIVESIDPAIFHLTNEFRVSYFIGSQVYDKKYIFVPDSLKEENLTFIEEIGLEGVLHP